MNLNSKIALLLSMGIIMISGCKDQGVVSMTDPYAIPGSHPMIADSGTALTSTGSGDVIGYMHRGGQEGNSKKKRIVIYRLLDPS